LPITRRERKMLEWRDRLIVDTTVTNEGCWIWQGRLDECGYGRTTYGRELGQLAHRLSYRLFVSEIPEGSTLDHLCGKPACVNPLHLEAVSLYANIMRGNGLGAQRARQTRCGVGHEFTPENTYRFPDGRRGCRACRKDARRRRYLEKGD
jgi:hypothetical protein